MKHQQLTDETEASDGVSGAKKLKTSVDENMPSFVDMMAYIQKKVGTTDDVLCLMMQTTCVLLRR